MFKFYFGFRIFYIIDMKPSIFSTEKQRPIKFKTKKRDLKLKTIKETRPSATGIFNKLILNRKRTFVNEKLKDYYGKNFVIEYQDKFNFQQEWQDKNIQQKEIIKNYVLQESFQFVLSSIFIILVFTTSIWLSSVDLFIRSGQRTRVYAIVYSLSIISLVIEFFLKVKKQVDSKNVQMTLKYWVKKSYKQLFCVVSYALKISMVDQKTDVFWVIFELIAIYFQYRKVSNLYKSLRLMSYSLHYEYHSKICDLLINLFIILHCVAVVLYLSTLMNYQHTWINSLDIDDSNEFIVYIYSFYFGSTTVLTVGYGDISPKNPGEIVVTCFVQIVGIVTFAFIINEIGYSIGNLRKAQQIMEKDLSVMEKMRKHYKISEKLLSNARSFIVNSKPDFEQLYPNEEKNLMIKLNEQLRHNLSKQTTLSVVKSSIFFLTRWSKAFSQAIASKIQHNHYSDNDLLYQPPSKERIYIIKKGKINIYAEKGGRKKGQNNLLKTIKMDGSIEVADSCYGTTAVISTRPVRLYAIAKDNTSAYYVDKGQFEECISQRMSDFEYYHELKCKIDSSDIWEEFEAPMIRSSKHHYNPTRRIILQRYIKRGYQKSMRNQILQRSNRRQKLGIVIDQQQCLLIRHRVSSYTDSHNYFSLTQNSLDSSSHQKDKRQKSQVKQQIPQIFVVKFQNAAPLYHIFQASKQYVNYYPKKNLRQILKILQIENNSQSLSKLYESQDKPKSSAIQNFQL